MKYEFATIHDLPIHSKEKLTVQQREQLSRIIEDEYHNQTTELQASRRQAEREALDKIKKDLGVDKILKQVYKLQAEVRIKTEELGRLGFDHMGNVTGRDIGNQVAEMTKAFSAPRSEKNKIIARLHLCKTQGEAAVVLQHVLGNSIIPHIAKNEVVIAGILE